MATTEMAAATASSNGTMEQVRKELLAALNNKSPNAWSDALVQLMARDAAKDDDFKLEEFLQTVADKDQAKVWEGVSARVGPLIEKVVEEDDEEEEEEEEVDDDDSTGAAGVRRRERAEETWQAFRVLQAVVAMAQATLQVVPKTTSAMPEGLLQVMIALHDVLFHLSGVDGEALQGAIVRVCEQWWKEERGGAEYLVAQTVPYLVARSLEEDAREVLVKRVYAMRGALLLLDYEEEATGPFRHLLLQCFLKPTYLRAADGRRLLTYLFGLHPDLIADIHETVKAQLPHAKKKLVQAYGDVYFRAWKAAQGPYLEAIETGCVQDLMHSAVNCSTPSLYATLRLFLQSFHSNKRLREVDAMLLRLYNPIIWRSLQVANPTVRAQATGLLVDAFPLQNPDMGTIDAAGLLQKQLDMLQGLLIDPEPHVRVAAVMGVCRILSVFWEAIPLHVTKAYITRLVGSLAFDSASALVRLAVVEGLAELLDQPLAHPVLKTALPLTAPLLNDKTPRVRSAFVALLQKVKSVRDIKFYQVVPVEHLLARFAVDANKATSGALSSRMADLLLNSYFPQGQGVTGSKQVSRCLTFLSQSKPAALAFYSRLREHVGLGAVTRLTAMLLKCVFAALADQEAAAAAAAGSKEEGGKGKTGAAAASKKKTARPERKRGRGKAAMVDELADSEEDEGEQGSSKEQEEKKRMSEVDEATLSGMLEVIAVLWASIARELEEPANQPAAELLQQTLASEDMGALYDKLADPSSLLRLAALCPEIFAMALGAPMTKDLKEGQGKEADLRAGPIAALLCAWGKTTEVVALIAKGLEAAVGVVHEDTDAGAGKRKRGTAAAASSVNGALGAQLATVGQLSPTRALAMLSHLLSGQGEAALKARGLVLAVEAGAEGTAAGGGGQIMAALETVKAAVEERLVGNHKLEGLGGVDRAVLVGIMEVYFRWQLHVFGEEALAAATATGVTLPLSGAMQTSLTWVGQVLLPTALQMEMEDAAANKEDGGAGPFSPPARRARKAGGSSGGNNKKDADEDNRATFAQELFAASMMVVSDWIAVLPAAAEAMTDKATVWAQSFFLPGMAAQPEEGETEAEARDRKYAVLTLLPQLCRVAYQLGLQETRQSNNQEHQIQLPPPLVEVLVRAADYHPDELPWHRYKDSNVDAARCLAGLLGLYGRLRSNRPALMALVNRLTALCLQELEDHAQQDEVSVSEVQPSARMRALCAVLVRSNPALNLTVSQTLAELKETVTSTVATAAAARGKEEGQVQGEREGEEEEAMATATDTTAEEAKVALRARLLCTLFETAAEKPRTTLLPKVNRSLEATMTIANEEVDAETEAGKLTSAEGLKKMAMTLEGLGQKLQEMALQQEAVTTSS